MIRGMTYFSGANIVPDDISQCPLPWQEKGLQYTATGYGSKIPTSRMAKVGKRWYRIYCCVYSNSGTCYIRMGGVNRIISEV
jgi:hypothetical protein